MGNAWNSALLLDAPFQISSIGEDEEGNMYVADYAGNSIYMIVDASAFELENPSGNPTPKPRDTSNSRR